MNSQTPDRDKRDNTEISLAAVSNGLCHATCTVELLQGIQRTMHGDPNNALSEAQAYHTRCALQVHVNGLNESISAILQSRPLISPENEAEGVDTGTGDGAGDAAAPDLDDPTRATTPATEQRDASIQITPPQHNELTDTMWPVDAPGVYSPRTVQLLRGQQAPDAMPSDHPESYATATAVPSSMSNGNQSTISALYEHDAGNPFAEEDHFPYSNELSPRPLYSTARAVTGNNDDRKTQPVNAEVVFDSSLLPRPGPSKVINPVDRYKTPASHPVLLCGPRGEALPPTTIGTHPPNPRFWEDPLSPGPMIHSEILGNVPIVAAKDAANSGAQNKSLGKGKKLLKLLKKPAQALSNLHMAGMSRYEDADNGAENTEVAFRPTVSNPIPLDVKIPAAYPPASIIDLDRRAMAQGSLRVLNHPGTISHPPSPIITPTFCQSAIRIPLYTVPVDWRVGVDLERACRKRPMYWQDGLSEQLNKWLMKKDTQVQDIKLYCITIGGMDHDANHIIAKIDVNADRIRMLHARLPPETRLPSDPPEHLFEWVIFEIVWSFEKRHSSIFATPRRSIFHTSAMTSSISCLRLGRSAERCPAVSGYNSDFMMFEDFTKAFDEGMGRITVSTEPQRVEMPYFV